MRTANILMTVLFLSVPGSPRAQADHATTGAPEVFNGTAEVKNANGAISGRFEVRLNRYTPDFDRASVETALRQGGYPRFLPALRKAPEVGQLVLGGSAPYAIRYAREKVEAGVRTIVLVTDKPVFFVGAWRADAKPQAGYEVALVQIQIDAKGQVHGTLAAAARVRPDGDGGVLLDSYTEEPAELTNLTRKAL